VPADLRGWHRIVRPCPERYRRSTWCVPRVVAAIDRVVEQGESYYNVSIESGCASCSVSTVEATDFLADTVIQLNRERRDRRVRRSLEIVKAEARIMNRRAYAAYHGVTPRGVSAVQRLCGLFCATTHFQCQAISHRVEAVDTLIGGGIFDGSTTMVVGVSGVERPCWEANSAEGALKQERGIARVLG